MLYIFAGSGGGEESKREEIYKKPNTSRSGKIKLPSGNSLVKIGRHCGTSKAPPKSQGASNSPGCNNIREIPKQCRSMPFVPKDNKG